MILYDIISIIYIHWLIDICTNKEQIQQQHIHSHCLFLKAWCFGDLRLGKAHGEADLSEKKHLNKGIWLSIMAIAQK